MSQESLSQKSISHNNSTLLRHTEFIYPPIFFAKFCLVMTSSGMTTPRLPEVFSRMDKYSWENIHKYLVTPTHHRGGHGRLLRMHRIFSPQLTMRPSCKSTPKPLANRPVSVRVLPSSGSVMNPIECRDSKLRATELVSGGSIVLCISIQASKY